jgi:hypothetical protein
MKCSRIFFACRSHSKIKFEFELKWFEFIKDFKNGNFNLDNPLTQLTRPEIRDKVNPARDKDFALPELNPT